MSVKRLELLTNGLKGRCSTIELHARRGTFYHAPPDASTDLDSVTHLFAGQDSPYQHGSA
jgi:hypothetical protein